MWVQTIEQLLLLLLILGRWFLPKGEITRDQLSQLLFVYMGMASDIMEILVLFSEDSVLGDYTLSYVVLGVWSFSLLQFTIVLTATRARKPRVAHVSPETAVVKARNTKQCIFWETEIWAIFTTVIMQDAPFLSVRLYSMIYHKIFNYTVLFFTCKNALIVSLQIYRIAVILAEDGDGDSDSMRSKDSISKLPVIDVEEGKHTKQKIGKTATSHITGQENKSFHD